MLVLRETTFDVVNVDVFKISSIMMVHDQGVALVPAAMAIEMKTH